MDACTDRRIREGISWVENRATDLTRQTSGETVHYPTIPTTDYYNSEESEVIPPCGVAAAVGLPRAS